MDTKWWIGVALTVWSNIIATIALILSIKKDPKKKTASHRPRKHKGKR